jgi:hypothetical protein
VVRDDATSETLTQRTALRDVQYCFILFYFVAAADGSPYFAPMMHFVSHAWLASFMHLVATLELYARGTDNKAAFFLDIFAINQHVPPWREDPPMRHGDVLGPPIVAWLRAHRASAATLGKTDVVHQGVVPV